MKLPLVPIALAGLGLYLLTRDNRTVVEKGMSEVGGVNTHGVITASPFAPNWNPTWNPLIGAPVAPAPLPGDTQAFVAVPTGMTYQEAIGQTPPNRIPLVPGTYSTPGNEVLNQFGQLIPAVQGSSPR